MKIDVRDGYGHQAIDKVFVDNWLQTNCISIDTDAGVVIRYKTNEKGEILHINGNLCKEELNGKVKVVFKRGWSITPDGNYVYYGKVHKPNPIKWEAA